VVRETVLDVRLPKTTRLDRIEVRRIPILRGHAAGLHVHNGPVLGSIVEGSVVYQVEASSGLCSHRARCFMSRRALVSLPSTQGTRASRSWPTSC
jgi:hypothetical protein